MKFLCQINFVILAIIVLLPFSMTSGLAETFDSTHVGRSNNFEDVRDIERSATLDLKLPVFNFNFANNSNFVFEEIGAASGAASYTKTQKEPENRFDPLNLAISVIVVSLIGIIIYRSSDSEFPLTK